MQNKKRHSPFSVEFWLEKGYSSEEAEYKRNSIRPIKKEYWLERGYSFDDAIKKAEEVKFQNNKKGAKISAEKPKLEHKKRSKRCKEYWLDLGYSEEDSILKVKESQSTFSLEKCIIKYGLEKGNQIWKARQDKWMSTLQSKSEKDKQEINPKKNSIILKDSLEETISYYKNNRNMNLVATLELFKDNLIDTIRKNPLIQYYDIDYYLDNFVPKIQIEIFGSRNLLKEYILDLFDTEYKEYFLSHNSKYNHYKMRTKEGLLRSSLEIHFYRKFKERFKDKELSLDKRYPNSSMRYDFMVNDIFIEIAPLYNIDEKYTEKMNKKKSLFGCILLTNSEEIDNFIENMELL